MFFVPVVVDVLVVVVIPIVVLIVVDVVVVVLVLDVNVVVVFGVRITAGAALRGIAGIEERTGSACPAGADARCRIKNGPEPIATTGAFKPSLLSIGILLIDLNMILDRLRSVQVCLLAEHQRLGVDVPRVHLQSK